MENILFTRQFHQAERAGDHYDYRLVSGGKAYSWATRKQMPEPGSSIILWEQPVHTAEYALSKRLVIPKGQYGAGITTLDIVKKAKVHPDSTKDKIKFTTATGESFLLKKLPEKYGNKAWLFRNISEKENMEKKANKYLTKISMLVQQYRNKETNEVRWHKEGDRKLRGEDWVLLKGHARYVKPGKKT